MFRSLFIQECFLSSKPSFFSFLSTKSPFVKPIKRKGEENKSKWRKSRNEKRMYKCTEYDRSRINHFGSEQSKDNVRAENA